MMVKVKLFYLNGTPERISKVSKAIYLLERVINSEEFKNKVLSSKFSNCGSLSNKQIFEILLYGRENFKPIVDYQWDIEVKFYFKRFSRVIGYTLPGISYINCNTKYYDKFSPIEIAGNLAHEYSHKLGFDHNSANESSSVPYLIGSIIEELAGEYV